MAQPPHAMRTAMPRSIVILLSHTDADMVDPYLQAHIPFLSFLKVP